MLKASLTEQADDLTVALTTIWDDIIDAGRTSVTNEGCVAGSVCVAGIESGASVGAWFNMPPLHQSNKKSVY